MATKTFTYKGHTYTITPIEGVDAGYVVTKDYKRVRRTKAWRLYEECDNDLIQAEVANLFNNKQR